MPSTTETVTLAGSGLVFENWYGAGVTPAFRDAIITAENMYQNTFTDQVKVVMSFDLGAMSADFSGRNDFNVVNVSYDTFVDALKARATTADDQAALQGLPTSDPSKGAGFNLTAPQARILGLATQTYSIDDAVVLNSALPWSFGKDTISVLEHEISEGVFGRLGSLGQGGVWQAMDLFRFDAAGQRTYTGGADGVQAFFGIDAAHVTNLQYHGGINAAGVGDGFSVGDWDHANGDTFGPGGPGVENAMSATDYQILDILGWTPKSASPAPAAAGSNAAATQAPGGSAGERLVVSASSQVIGGVGNDTIVGGGAADYLRGGDGDDSVQGGAGFDDINGNKGADTIDGGAGGAGGGDWLVGGQGDDLIISHTGANLLYGNLGNDTLVAGGAGDVARGGQGDDSVSGGAGSQFISGDRGADTVAGGAGADTFHFSQDAGVDRVLDFNYAEGDRVLLDPGMTYAAHQVGADAVIDAGDGNEMILVGVQLNALGSGWILGA